MSDSKKMAALRAAVFLKGLPSTESVNQDNMARFFFLAKMAYDLFLKSTEPNDRKRYKIEPRVHDIVKLQIKNWPTLQDYDFALGMSALFRRDLEERSTSTESDISRIYATQCGDALWKEAMNKANYNQLRSIYMRLESLRYYAMDPELTCDKLVERAGPAPYAFDPAILDSQDEFLLGAPHLFLVYSEALDILRALVKRGGGPTKDPMRFAEMVILILINQSSFLVRMDRPKEIEVNVSLTHRTLLNEQVLHPNAPVDCQLCLDLLMLTSRFYPSVDPNQNGENSADQVREETGEIIKRCVKALDWHDERSLMRQPVNRAATLLIITLDQIHDKLDDDSEAKRNVVLVNKELAQLIDSRIKNTVRRLATASEWKGDSLSSRAFFLLSSVGLLVEYLALKDCIQSGNVPEINVIFGRLMKIATMATALGKELTYDLVKLEAEILFHIWRIIKISYAIYWPLVKPLFVLFKKQLKEMVKSGNKNLEPQIDKYKADVLSIINGRCTVDLSTRNTKEFQRNAEQWKTAFESLESFFRS